MEKTGFQNLYEQKARLLIKIMKMSEEQRKKLMKALDYATNAHSQQKRKNGRAYIIHPIRVANALIEEGEEPDVLIAALLHDVVEDTEKTMDEIKNEFGEKVAEIVEALTKKENESRESYLMRVSLNKTASKIKAYDALDNIMDLESVLKKESESKEWVKEHLAYWESIVKRFGNEEMKKILEEEKKLIEELLK